MAVFGGIIFGIYMVGFLLAFFVYSWRVGLGLWWPLVFLSAWAHEPSRRNGLPWVVLTCVKAWAWPVVFGAWLANGRPPSRVLYGYAAAERMGFKGDELPYHMRGFASKWKTPGVVNQART